MPKSKRPLQASVMLLFALSWSDVSSADTAKRPIQDYGGLQRDTGGGDAVAWVPRIVLYPLWLTSEYVVRRPMGALVKVAERDQWSQSLVDFFTFGERKQISVVPSALLDFGLKPSVGFNLEWKYFLAEKNTMQLHFGTWGPDWIAARATSRYAVNDRETFGVELSYVRRKDNLFYGMGSSSVSGDEARFQSNAAEAKLTYEQKFWRASRFNAQVGARALEFDRGTCCEAPSVSQAIARGRFAAPPGFGDDYTALFQGVSLVLDTRRERPASGGGMRVELHGDAVFSPDWRSNNLRRTWLRYGAFAGGAVDIGGSGRIVSLGVAVEFAEPLLGQIPFTDQVSLGGDRQMRGYLANRLIDGSSAVATAAYSWPVWVYLDGVAFVDVGNVFGNHLAGVSAELLRVSAGMGLRSNGDRDSSFELLVAGGTDTIDQGLAPSSFRLVLGSHHGF